MRRPAELTCREPAAAASRRRPELTSRTRRLAACAAGAQRMPDGYRYMPVTVVVGSRRLIGPACRPRRRSACRRTRRAADRRARRPGRSSPARRASGGWPGSCGRRPGSTPTPCPARSRAGRSASGWSARKASRRAARSARPRSGSARRRRPAAGCRAPGRRPSPSRPGCRCRRRRRPGAGRRSVFDMVATTVRTRSSSGTTSSAGLGQRLGQRAVVVEVVEVETRVEGRLVPRGGQRRRLDRLVLLVVHEVDEEGRVRRAVDVAQRPGDDGGQLLGLALPSTAGRTSRRSRAARPAATSPARPGRRRCRDPSGSPRAAPALPTASASTTPSSSTRTLTE